MPGDDPITIISLSTPGVELSEVGGKGFSLGLLAQAGLPVPDGFILSTYAYQKFLAAHRLQEEICQAWEQKDFSRQAALQHLSHSLRTRILSLPLPVDIAAQIEQAYTGSFPGNAAVAVRSSATVEDSARASFAGQLDSMLNVQGVEALICAVRTCWASLWTERALAYCLAKGIPVHQVSMAVIIQRMLPAAASGVLFSANPLDGNPHQLWINAAWGPGETLVGGRVNPDTILLDKRSHAILEQKIADKQVMAAPAAGGTEERAVPDAERRLPVLSGAQAAELAGLAERVEQLYQAPVDIEWALVDGAFWLLQARPITALPSYPGPPDPFSWNDSLRGKTLWSNVNFGEAITRVMTPLTWSVLQFTLKDWQYIPGVSTLGNIGGYPYLNISVFYSLLRAMGKNRQDLADALEATMYLELPDDLDAYAFPLSTGNFLLSLVYSAKVQMKQTLGVSRTPAYLAANLPWFQDMVKKIKAAESGPALRALFDHEIRSHILDGVWCVLGSAVHSANFTIKLRRELEKLAGAQDASALIGKISEKNGLLASLGPLLGLSRVASGEMARENYLEMYGHRGPDEFELSLPRPAEDPQWLDSQLALLRQSPPDVEELLQKQKDAFAGAWERLQHKHPRQAMGLRLRIDRSAQRARVREEARSAYVRDRWSLRLFALRAGELTGLGQDIFYLRLDEILRLLDGEREAVTYIPARKAAFERYSSLPKYPSLLLGAFDPLDGSGAPSSPQTAESPLGDANILLGSPGSGGVAQGVVRVIEDLEQGQALEPGEILCAYQTDIAWTLLFPRAAAIITAVGAPLSHAAIVARELGIPAVVGCANATRSLKTGDRVLVDGNRGMVFLDYNADMETGEKWLRSNEYGN